MITNQPLGMRIIDFIKPTDNYEDLYKIWYDFLETEKSIFVDENLYKEFVKRLIDRYYNRYISTQTLTEFKVRFRNFLNSKKEVATRLYHLKDLELELFFTNYQITRNDLTHILDTTNTTNNKSYNNNTTTTNGLTKHNTSNKHLGTDTLTNENEDFNVDSDLPKSAVKKDDLFTSEIYATKSNHNKSSNTNTNTYNSKNEIEDVTNVIDNITTNKGDSNYDTIIKNNGTNKDINTNKTYGYNGNVTELLNNYLKISLDVINFYLDEVEHYGLFKKILY